MSERFSAEPGRKKAYSEDIRWRIVWQKIALNCSFRDMAQNLNIQRVALQRSAAMRGMFMSSVLMYGRDMFVWVDETGCNRKDLFRK